MSDCENAEIRDRLPDLIHDRLDAYDRATVMAHIEGCAACRDEVELLRAARAMFDARAPRVDVGRIVRALPSPVPARQRRWVDWRVAAAIVVMLAGGGSVALLSRGVRALPGDSVAVAPVVATPVTGAPNAD